MPKVVYVRHLVALGLRNLSADPGPPTFGTYIVKADLSLFLSFFFCLRASSIKYLHVDKAGKEVWTPLLSDWDLDTAILGRESSTPLR
jgi:hypothetical protein